MTPPDEKQLQETPEAAAGTMVRACERCGTVCSTDQEWCLSCGVRMTEPSQRLPGLRAAGLVVSLAVVLSGGAAAASYAALRGDTRSAANVPTDTVPTVAQAPTTTPTTPPVDPTVDAPTSSLPPSTSDIEPDTSLDDSGDLDDSTADVPDSPPLGTEQPAPLGDPGPSGGTGGGSTGTGTGTGSGTGSGGTGGTGSSTGTGKDKGTGSAKDEQADRDAAEKAAANASGPVVFASGQGTIYDPHGVVEEMGDQGSAIDGDVNSAWKVTLKPDVTGDFGYVLDFDPATRLKTLNVVSGTAGLKVKVLGTSNSGLPANEGSAGWNTIAGETTLKSGSNTISLRAAAGASSRYKHVLVLITEVPEGDTELAIREFKATR